MRRRILEAIVVTAAAAALSLVAFLATAVPFDRFPGPERLQSAFVYLGVPVALFNRLLPEAARTHLTVFLHCDHTYCFPGPPEVEAARYVRVGVPAYALLFYVPALVVRRRRAVRKTEHLRRVFDTSPPPPSR